MYTLVRMFDTIQKENMTQFLYVIKTVEQQSDDKIESLKHNLGSGDFSLFTQGQLCSNRLPWAVALLNFSFLNLDNETTNVYLP